MSGGDQEFTQVDAFTDQVFRGNPAAVFVLDGPADATWMQAVALEMNLSETAFCHPRADAPAGEWDLRWFTPVAEVDLCGHATLATAHVLFTQHETVGEIGFHTRSGRLAALATDHGIRLNFPVDVVEAVPVTDDVLAAIGRPVIAAGAGATDLLVEVPSAADVRSCDPDQGLMAGLAHRAVIVTAACDDRDDVAVVSRVFSPNLNIPEDPVTGSAHTTLAVWWAPRLGNSFRAEQASARGGEMDVRVDGDRVHLTGSATTVARGYLVV